MVDWKDEPASAGEASADGALAEVTNNVRYVAPAAPRDQGAAKTAADKGWAAPTLTAQPPTVETTSAETSSDEPTPEQSLAALNAFHNEFTKANPTHAASAAKFEWSDEFGDVAPRNPGLEEDLFGGQLRVRVGSNFGDLTNFSVVVEGTNKILPVMNFGSFGFHPVMLENIKLCGYTTPTPIQCYGSTAMMQGYDLVGIAQTGSGKTLAYLSPSMSKLMGKAKKLRGPRGERVRAEPLLMVIVPTRELAIQIFDEARRLCYRSMLRPCVVYGGGPVREQRDDLRHGCDLLIATPGRLIDFLRDPATLSLHRVRFTIIDEADEMLGPDWSDELAQILNHSTPDAQHQYALFSATFPAPVRALAKKYLQRDYVRVRIGRTGSTLPHIKQQVFYIERNLKKDALYDLILAGAPCRTLIFVNSKKQVDAVDDFLFHKGLPVTSLTSDRTQLEREDAMRAFRSGKCPILILTGVGSRGLDIPNVLHTVNFDLPSIEYGGADEYIHRIGRTGRMGNMGLATSFYNEGDEPMAPFLAKILTENKQEVPDFLDQYKPADGEVLDFEDASEDEGEEGNADDSTAAATNGGEPDAWGAAETPVIAQREPREDTWGASGGNANNTTSAEW